MYICIHTSMYAYYVYIHIYIMYKYSEYHWAIKKLNIASCHSMCRSRELYTKLFTKQIDQMDHSLV